MKTNFRLLLFLVVSFCMACSYATNSVSAQQPIPENSTSVNSEAIKVILDTDPSYDPDDAGCMAMLHGMANNGELEILAVINSFSHYESSQAISAINHFYNRKSIPVGEFKYAEMTNAPETNYDHYLANNYPRELKNDAEVPEGYKLYREILAGSEDESVIIVVIGTMHNLEALLNSKPDDFSDLNGIELVRKKVKRVSSMGGNFVYNGSGFDRTNWGGSEKLCEVQSWACLNQKRNDLTRFVIDNLPVPLYASGWEMGDGNFAGAENGRVATGQELKTLAPNHIVRKAYEQHYASRGGRENIDRHSNDQAALLYGIRGTAGVFDEARNGTIKLSDKGVVTWSDETDRQHSYVIKKAPDQEIADLIEALMLAPVQEADGSAPDTPPNVSATVNSESTKITWDRASDNTIGGWVAAYNVYRNDEYIGTSYGLQFFDRNPVSGTTRYSVKALNTNGIESKKSTITMER